MGIVFLDIDGVLHTDRCVEEECSSKAMIHNLVTCIDNEALKNLEQIVAATNSKIVISSDWRINQSTTNIFWTSIVKHLSIAGIYSSVVGTTPVSKDKKPGNRGKEILSWLSANPKKCSGNFVILDDEQDFCEDIRKRLVLCDPYHGIDSNAREQAIQMLTNGNTTG